MAITINVNLDEILAALKNDLDFTGNADKYIKVNATADGFEFAAVSGGGTWGSITGTLSDQTDLQSALDAKYDASNPSGYITGIAWGAITGTLSSQTDLQSALDLKANLAGASFTGDVSVTTSGSGDTLQLTNSGSGTTLNILNSGSGDLFKIDTDKLVVDNGGDVSIGTAAASARFHVLTGSTSKVGAIIQAAAGQTANLLEVKDSGAVNRYVIQANGVPYTNIGSTLPQTNVAFGNTALNSLTSGQRNTAVGFKAGLDLTTGTRNTLIGEASGENVTTSQGNVFIGNDAGNSITTQGDNVIIGSGADSTGTQNSVVGKGAGGFATGDFNSFFGETSGESITNDRNAFYGWRSGRYIADGTTAATTIADSVYLGAETKASANSISNEIVIGYNAIGNGSNSVTLGNTSVTDTYLRGNVQAPKLSLTSATTSSIPLTVTAAAGQTANLLEVKDSGGSNIVHIAPSNFRFNVNQPDAIRINGGGSRATFSINGSYGQIRNEVGVFYFDNIASSDIIIRTAVTTRMVIANDGLIKLGGTTNLFPALKRSSTDIQVRLADDTNYANIDAALYKVGGTSGFTGTGSYTNFTIVGGIITNAS